MQHQTNQPNGIEYSALVHKFNSDQTREHSSEKSIIVDEDETEIDSSDNSPAFQKSLCNTTKDLLISELANIQVRDSNRVDSLANSFLFPSVFQSEVRRLIAKNKKHIFSWLANPEFHREWVVSLKGHVLKISGQHQREHNELYQKSTMLWIQDLKSKQAWSQLIQGYWVTDLKVFGTQLHLVGTGNEYCQPDRYVFVGGLPYPPAITVNHQTFSLVSKSSHQQQFEFVSNSEELAFESPLLFDELSACLLLVDHCKLNCLLKQRLPHWDFRHIPTKKADPEAQSRLRKFISQHSQQPVYCDGHRVFIPPTTLIPLSKTSKTVSRPSFTPNPQSFTK